MNFQHITAAIANELAFSPLAQQVGVFTQDDGEGIAFTWDDSLETGKRLIPDICANGPVTGRFACLRLAQASESGDFIIFFTDGAKTPEDKVNAGHYSAGKEEFTLAAGHILNYLKDGILPA